VYVPADGIDALSRSDVGGVTPISPVVR